MLSTKVDYWAPSYEPRLGQRNFPDQQEALKWARAFCHAFSNLRPAVRFHGFIPNAADLQGITLKAPEDSG